MDAKRQELSAGTDLRIIGLCFITDGASSRRTVSLLAKPSSNNVDSGEAVSTLGGNPVLTRMRLLGIPIINQGQTRIACKLR